MCRNINVDRPTNMSILPSPSWVQNKKYLKTTTQVSTKRKGFYTNSHNNRSNHYYHILYMYIIISYFSIITQNKIVAVEGFTAKLVPIHQVTTTTFHNTNHGTQKRHQTHKKQSDDNSESSESSNNNHKDQEPDEEYSNSKEDDMNNVMKQKLERISTTPNDVIINGNHIIVNHPNSQYRSGIVDGLPFMTATATTNTNTVEETTNKVDVSATTKSEDTNPTILSSLPTLIKLSRPKNFPVSILLHCLSVHLVLKNLPRSTKTSLLTALVHPSLLLTLTSILLLSATSMIINDYYDARNGVDTVSNHYHPISSGDIPLPLVKRFLSYLYTGLLLGTVALPGIYTRISAVIGTMLTFWYTQHLKPKTWIKNVVCAGLIGISPLASGLATAHIYSSTSTSTTSILTTISPLLRMVFILCMGVMSREITMDIVDYHGDKLSNIFTIPVRYGRRLAANVCMTIASINSIVILLPPLLRVLRITNSASPTSMIAQRVIQLCMATVGAGIVLYDSYKVRRTEGLDETVSNDAVNHANIAILLVLASFI